MQLFDQIGLCISYLFKILAGLDENFFNIHLMDTQSCLYFKWISRL
jgi:hypothetical protein